MGDGEGTRERIHQSYLFLTWFKPEDHDEALAMAKRGGFKQILFEQHCWAASMGRYGVNEKIFPGGFSQLKDIFEHFNQEGIKVGLHVLDASVDSGDPYMTPVPDERFLLGCKSVLASDIPDRNEPITILTTDDASCFPVGEDPIWDQVKSFVLTTN